MNKNWRFNCLNQVLVLFSALLLSSFYVLESEAQIKVSRKIADHICQQHDAFQETGEIQPVVKHFKKHRHGDKHGHCGWWTWARSESMLLDSESRNTIVHPANFRFHPCVKNKETGKIKKYSLGAAWAMEKFNHQPKSLTPEESIYFATKNDSECKSFDWFLDPIMVVRVPDTEGSTKVREFISTELKDLGWELDVHSFEEETPLGQKTFSNVIATLNPNVARRLVLACHYDSKLFEDFEFVAAMDSAVPCAMLLHLAFDLKDSLNSLKADEEAKVTLQFMFFDGEEALVEWRDNDNTYGSRAYATHLSQVEYPPGNEDQTFEIDRMDMLMLLDLLGPPNPIIANAYNNTFRWFDLLVSDETWLRENELWMGNKEEEPYFRDKKRGTIGDDHIHFLKRGVPCLHIIRSNFGKIWHTVDDNRDSLDFDHITNLERVFRLFVARYLHLKAVDSSDQAR